ncbi:hypothetical protein F511_13359 [Dorcoceras hygrometricum]|uniref:EF-hand domain-containing protein n=1 Tax=Dorcoceras hygrometricum TaxID=472368 RepID=A0A2Z7CC41_9LAMI|nr:hypothetical protein F511_13359 [Dorcoceras hygrometricum]
MEDPTRKSPLTKEEEVEQVFKKFDTNGDGRISLSELVAVLDVLGSSTGKDEAAGIMLELDVDGDGFIDLNEFKAFQCGGGDKNKELREAFDLYDQDKNGKISVTELHAVLKILGEKCSLKDCRRMISNVDVDGDGCVNFEEFKKMMTGAA